MSRLEARNIVMQFPAVRALDDVSIDFEPGEVHGIVGENGAGKSTLMNILGGVLSATSGTVLIDGKPLGKGGVKGALAHGIAMIHQELNLVETLTAAENIFLGREISRLGLLDLGRMKSATETFLKQVHATFGALKKVSELSIAGKQLVEIAKAISTDASVLIMDEPTAVLSEPEAESLFELISKLKERGVTVLYISHRLLEVCKICDRITVLRDGVKVTTVGAREVDPAKIADLMVGRPLSDFYPAKTPAAPQEPVLLVHGVRGISFTVRPGEIVGIAGLVGAGRTELAETIFGARRGSGTLTIGNRDAQIRSPGQAVKHGIAYVSEDRKALGLHLSLSGVHNVTMANLRSYGSTVTRQAKELESAETWKKALDIRVADMRGAVREASGGNQQKISIAKWLETKPRVLILDEPTRGVDVGAKREMYALIQRLASDGMACIVISSDLPEIIGLCHRTLVMREGKLVGDLSGSELSEEAVMRLAAGVAA